MKSKERIFLGKNPYVARNDGAYLRAVRENVRFHAEHNPKYARILNHFQFCADDLKSEADLCKIPVLPTLYFKRNELFSVPEEKLVLKATSSGTKGQKSTVGFDRRSMIRGLGMAVRFFAYHRMISVLPTNYIVLGYEPGGRLDLGAAKTAFGVTKFAPALHREYALKKTEQGYADNAESVLNALLRYERQGFPVRFVGFPAYLHFLVRELKRRGISLRLHKRSIVILGGGWKQFDGEKIDGESLFVLVQETLGIPRENCLEFFSAVEHPLPYCKCRNGHFHVPVYSRVIIRDAETLLPVPNGTPGILGFVSPLVTSMPLVSVMTDDIAVLHEAEHCGCGIETPYFELLGRANAKGIQTCAATAVEAAGGKRDTDPLVISRAGNGRTNTETTHIGEYVLRSLATGRLARKDVIAACDALSRKLNEKEHLPMLAALGIRPEEAAAELAEFRRILSREYLEARIEREFGGWTVRSFQPMDGDRPVRQAWAPLGVLLHIAAGNADALPVLSVIEGLLTENVNILKLPGGGGALSLRILSELIAIEPRIAEKVFVIDTPSSDAAAMQQLARAADAIVVWGGDYAVRAVRSMAQPDTRIIEWGHKISFAYVSGDEFREDELRGLAKHICETNQLLCSSCQGICLDTDSFERVVAFAERFFAILENTAEHDSLPEDPFRAAQTTIASYTEELETLRANKRVFRGMCCSVIAYDDTGLTPSCAFRNVWVRPLPRRELLTTLKQYKNHLQTAALICDLEQTEELEELLAGAGVVRITSGAGMSAHYCGMPHDGEFALRRYMKLVSYENEPVNRNK